MGTIAVHPRADVARLSGEIGYWLAEECWARGIATAAVTALTQAVFEHAALVRIYAPMFSQAGLRNRRASGERSHAFTRRRAFKLQLLHT